MSEGTERAVSPVVGTVLLVLVTILVVAVAGASVMGASHDLPAPGPQTAISVTADDAGTVAVTHEGGPPIDLRRVSLRVTIDGEPLREQPPVPFFSTSGFEPGPTGPFNSASDPEWTVGETGSVTVAGTNEPSVQAGATVVVRVVRDGQVLASGETSVGGHATDGDEG
ncbi:MAG: type IV pilin [Halanaeroarchaeum sp.]